MTPKVRVYIAGPMTGKPHHNFPAFDEAKAELEALGYEVVSPADIDRAFGITGDETPGTIPARLILEVMLVEMREIWTCKHIVLIDGWENSSGSASEITWGKVWKIKAILKSDFIDNHRAAHAS